MKWSNGRHTYHGLRNDRGKRKASKLKKGMTIDGKEMRRAFGRLSMEQVLAYEDRDQKLVLSELERHSETSLSEAE